jgi:hypothetical protein
MKVKYMEKCSYSIVVECDVRMYTECEFQMKRSDMSGKQRVWVGLALFYAHVLAWP